MTLQTAGALGEAMADTGYVAGYLSMSISMIAYMLVNKGGMMMASLAGGVMQGIQGIAARAADEATTGNISLGNNSQDNINWFKNDTSAMDNRGFGMSTGADGLQQRITDSGGRFENSPISAAANQQTVSSLRSGHSMSVESANQQGVAYADSLGAAHADMTRLSNAINNGTVNTEGWNQNTRQEFNESWSQVQKLGQQFEEQHKLTEGSGAKVLAAVSVGGTIPFTDIGGRVEAQGYSDAAKSELVQAAKAFAEETGFTNAHSRAVASGTELATQNRQDVTDSLGTDVSATLTKTQTHQQQWQAHLKQAETYQAAIDQVSSQGGSLGIDLSGAAQKHLESAGEFSHNEARRLLAGLNSGTLSNDDRLRLMDSLNRFGDQQAKLYAAQFTRDDLRGTYEGADKPAMDTGSVPGRGQVTGVHGNTAASINTDAEGRGVPPVADINAESANRQATVHAEEEAMRNKLEQEQHLVRTQGNERQEKVEGDLDQSASGALARNGYEASPLGRGMRKNR